MSLEHKGPRTGWSPKDAKSYSYTINRDVYIIEIQVLLVVGGGFTALHVCLEKSNINGTTECYDKP